MSWLKCLDISQFELVEISLMASESIEAVELFDVFCSMLRDATEYIQTLPDVHDFVSFTEKIHSGNSWRLIGAHEIGDAMNERITSVADCRDRHACPAFWSSTRTARASVFWTTAAICSLVFRD